MTEKKAPLNEKQRKYRAWYQANREQELMRKAKKTSTRHVLRKILNSWEKQGIPEKEWGVYGEACVIIGRIPRVCFKIKGNSNE